jgi:aconitase B
MHRRALLVAAIVSMSMPAIADESISGQWQANLGHNVIIAMDVLADGYWTSQTVQGNKVVAQMAGSYEQKSAGATTGTIVFTPVKAKTTEEHGAAQVEEDKYTLEQGGKVLRLVSNKSDVMVFHKQAYAK